ncbi:DUF4097 family beta strand repeat-containing protein [Sunxiuqinia sp. A32]|uniref:DUF4097 family beta strand repeat-containing protein n=1 Tax=Sunxiuqinia sp. A32 TaxID=3461496 RepID=UPI004045D675
MNKLSRHLIFILVALLAGSVTAQAQFTETKEFTKRFKVTPGKSIEIANKYGKIELITWKKDSVVIEVKMRVEEKKSTKLDKALDNIDFDFTESQHYLIARTIADKNRSQLESEFLKFKETLLQTDGSIEIDYKVWLPATNPLKVENKFGDIYIDDYEGEAEISLSNGKLKAHNLNAKTTINLNFADATINSLSYGRVESNYSDIYIKQGNQIRYSGKSSEIEIIEIADLTVDSRRDKFRIKQIGLLEADANFSNIRISDLLKRATLRFTYGDLEIENTAVDFENIYIESKSTDINLFFSTDSNFGFEIRETKADLDLTREMDVQERKEIDSKDGTTRLKGKFGTDTEVDEKLYINALSGKVTIETN